MKNVSCFQESLTGLDRSTLAARLMQRYGWNRQQTEQAIHRYLMFLFIAAQYPNLSLVTTDEIDRVWEEDILQNTQQYIEQCEQLCGWVIHHVAETELYRQKDFQDTDTAFAQTKALIEQHFGAGAWGDETEQAACGRPASHCPTS